MRNGKDQTGTVATNGEAQSVGVRLDAATLARVDAARAKIETETPGLKVSRSEMLRALAVRGLGPVVPVPAAVKRAARGARAPKGASVEGVELGAGGPVAVKGEC